MAHQASASPDATSLLLSTHTVEDFLRALADSALALYPAADGCGVTLERPNRPLTVVSAGISAPELDEAQYGQDDGPCLEALRTGEEVMVEDMLSEERWGPYPAYAVSRGTRSSISLPIAARTRTVGALNLYAPKPAGLDDADLTGLRALASQATGAIALAQRMADTDEYVADLLRALRSRSIIDQAIGIIMGRQRCTAEEAFTTLRRASQHRNIKLRDLCTELITNISGKPPSGGRTLPPRP
ncbi:GAF and ANTAR domain-containing protein [Streptomyces sporangiiformans]|uniref:GAF and ANTAR domain-containing protein n=1 Tax=Streptomyces sporangiiformans TaxID=2315329 RepID=A0A505D0Z4_9ACTN|nr:GAF and ANTAR domain-containing protein [Streptomyces sporangiiformans]TPQ18043.1 GAF and ANTAR domain-containing protein [Streptomyces sporangiiformans]